MLWEPTNNIKPLIKWLIGDVLPEGYLALEISIENAWQLYSDSVEYVICFNNLKLSTLKRQLKILAEIPVYFYDQSSHRSAKAGEYGWKFYPLKLTDNRRELWLDNDLILFDRHPDIDEFLFGEKEIFLFLEDIQRVYRPETLDRFIPRSLEICGGLLGLPAWPTTKIHHSYTTFLSRHDISGSDTHFTSPMLARLGIENATIALLYLCYPDVAKIISNRDIPPGKTIRTGTVGNVGMHFTGLNRGPRRAVALSFGLLKHSKKRPRIPSPLSTEALEPSNATPQPVSAIIKKNQFTGSMAKRGWLTVTSRDYIDYSIIACCSIRKYAGKCGSLPIVVVTADELSGDAAYKLNMLGCELIKWRDIAHRISKVFDIEFFNSTDVRRRAALVKAAAPVWSPFIRSCFFDADIMVLNGLDQLWNYQRPGRFAMAIEAEKPYASYIKDRSWLHREWGIDYTAILKQSGPLFSSGLILSDPGCVAVARRWISLLLRLEEAGWENAVVQDDQLWLTVALAEPGITQPVELPWQYHTLYLRHLRGENILHISKNRLEDDNNKPIRLLHLVGMKSDLENGVSGDIIDFVRSKIQLMLGKDSPTWAAV